MSARELYRLCQNDFITQPMMLREKFLRNLRMKDSFWIRLRKRFLKIQL